MLLYFCVGASFEEANAEFEWQKSGFRQGFLSLNEALLLLYCLKYLQGFVCIQTMDIFKIKNVFCLEIRLWTKLI